MTRLMKPGDGWENDQFLVLDTASRGGRLYGCPDAGAVVPVVAVAVAAAAANMRSRKI